MRAWRLVESGSLPPYRNMAEDEAILERFRDGDAPVLRIYGWRPAALSLGRFQSIDDVAALPSSIARVRRITGGGAIFHREDEVTYAIVASYALFAAKRAGPKPAYRAVHAAIARGLARLGVAIGEGGEASSGGASSARGPALCYDRATDFDLRAGAKKLVGSAQRRRGYAFLQHGSIPLSRDPYSRGATSLEELGGRALDRADVARAIREGLELELGARFEPSSLRDDEAALAAKLERERYAVAAWTAGAKAVDGVP